MLLLFTRGTLLLLWDALQRRRRAWSVALAKHVLPWLRSARGGWADRASVPRVAAAMSASHHAGFVAGGAAAGGVFGGDARPGGDAIAGGRRAHGLSAGAALSAGAPAGAAAFGAPAWLVAAGFAAGGHGLDVAPRVAFGEAVGEAVETMVAQLLIGVSGAGAASGAGDGFEVWCGDVGGEDGVACPDAGAAAGGGAGDAGDAGDALGGVHSGLAGTGALSTAAE